MQLKNSEFSSYCLFKIYIYEGFSFDASGDQLVNVPMVAELESIATLLK